MSQSINDIFSKINESDEYEISPNISVENFDILNKMLTDEMKQKTIITLPLKRLYEENIDIFNNIQVDIIITNDHTFFPEINKIQSEIETLYINGDVENIIIQSNEFSTYNIIIIDDSEILIPCIIYSTPENYQLELISLNESKYDNIINFKTYETLLNLSLSIISKNNILNTIQISDRLFTFNRLKTIIFELITLNMVPSKIIKNSWNNMSDILDSETEEFNEMFETLLTLYQQKYRIRSDEQNGVGVIMYLLVSIIMLEKSIYDNALLKITYNPSRKKEFYQEISFEFLSNIDSRNYIKNEQLIRKIYNDRKFNEGNLNVGDLFPSRNKYVYIEKSKPKIQECFSSMYKCRRCGEMKITFTEAVTRASDEPSTLYFKCANCGYRWQVNG